MQVFVISLRGKTPRRDNAARQLDAAGVQFQFFDAIRGANAAVRYPFDAIAEREFVLNTGRYITEPEIGCFASHRALWSQAVALEQPIAILEDDFQLGRDFPAALDSASRLIERLGFLRLQQDLRARKQLVTGCDGFVISRYTKAPHGSMCYCIAPAVARHFLSLTNIMNAPIDVFVKKFWEHGQPLYALTPYQVQSSDLSQTSTIGRPPKPPKPMVVSARRFLRKTAWEFRRSVFNLRQRAKPMEALVDPASTASANIN